MEEITIVKVKPQLVLALRRKGAYEEIAQMIPQLFQYAADKRAPIRGRPTFICHETTIGEAEAADKDRCADIEVVVPVGKEVEASGEFKCYRLPGGEMARVVHKGPYQECGPTYERFFAWLKENNKSMVGPTREIYLNDPMVVPTEEIETEIFAPIG